MTKEGRQKFFSSAKIFF